MRFLIAGSGTAEAELKEQAARLGLMEHGTFVGWTGDDVLHSLYRIADLCLVPSIYEPFGLVALEAMASGCPTIVADTGGLREVVPRGRRVGLRFRASSVRSLEAMAQQLLTDDALRERLVAEASEHVLRFDWAEVARETRRLRTPGRGPPPHAGHDLVSRVASSFTHSGPDRRAARRPVGVNEIQTRDTSRAARRGRPAGRSRALGARHACRPSSASPPAAPAASGGLRRQRSRRRARPSRPGPATRAGRGRRRRRP